MWLFTYFTMFLLAHVLLIILYYSKVYAISRCKCKLGDVWKKQLTMVPNTFSSYISSNA